MPEPEEEIRGYCMGATWQSKCHKECPLKKLEMKFESLGNQTGTYLDELKDNLKNINEILIVITDGRVLELEAHKNIKEVLRKLGKKVYDYIGAKNFGSWNDFIAKLDVPKTGCVGICGFCEIKDTCTNPKRLKQTEKNKKIEQRVAEIEKAIKDGKVAFHNIYHNTINTRIKNLCNTLGMKLNDTKSPTIAEMKKFSATLYDIVEGLRQGQVKLKEQQKIEHNNFKARAREKWRRMDELEGNLRSVVRIGKEVLHHYDGGEVWFPSEYENELRELLTKLDKKFSKTQLENVRDVEKKRLGENEKVVGAIPSIESIKKKPIASSEIDLPNPKSCDHVFTSQYPFWECGKCGHHKFDKSGSAVSDFTRGDSNPVGSTPTPDIIIHDLKTLPEFYQPHVERKKTFEIRFNDRDFKVGDYLLLKEWDGKKYTGRENTSEVTYILKADGSFFSFLDDYVIMGIKF